MSIISLPARRGSQGPGDTKMQAWISLTILRRLLSGRSSATAFRSALLLAQGGEFGFVLLDLSLGHGLLPTQAGQLLFAAILISMASSPFLIRYNQRLSKTFCRLRGSAGSHFGMKEIEAESREILQAAGLQRADARVLTFEEHPSAMKILQRVREVAPGRPVLVRTKDDSHLEELERAGAAEVMPEAVEASLMMGGQLLLLLKVPGSRIFKIMRDIRRDHYKLLRDFFHGEEALNIEHADAFQERLHTVTQPQHAHAVNHTIGEQHLWDWEVSITAVRRGGIRGESPGPETRLQAGDVRVLAGTPPHLAHAEGLLRYGR